MELTPTVLISLGPLAAAGLTRFKQEAVWRPAPVRRLTRAVFLGAAEPAPGTVSGRAVHGWTRGECLWVPASDEPWGSVAEVRAALNRVREQSLSAANLAAARAAGDCTVYVREYQETYAPEALLLVDATLVTPESLGRLVRLCAGAYERPVALLLVLPAPYREEWPAARELVRQAAGMAALERIWLVSPEQETGELLEPADLLDAINHFCHLFAYGGWPFDPALRPHFLRTDAERELGQTMLATFGLQGRRFSAPGAVRKALLDDGRALLSDLLDRGEPENLSPALGEALARGREEARRLAPEVPLPAPGDATADLWYARAKLRWAPEAQGAVHGAVNGALAPLLQWADGDLGDRPAQREAELGRLLKEVRRQQEQTVPPTLTADLSAAFDRLNDLRRSDRWPPLVVKALISTILSGTIGWTFFAPGSAETAALLMAAAWAILLGVLVGLNLRDRRRAILGLQAEARGWARERVEAMAYARSIQQLEQLAQLLERRRAEAAASVERLTEAQRLLEQEAAVAVLPPEATACSRPAPGAMRVGLEPVPAEELIRAEPAQSVETLLTRPWTPGEARGEEEPTPLPMPHLMLPVRAIHPGDGAPLITRHFTLKEDPFLRVRFALTQPFALLGSARFDPVLERRGDA